MQRAPAMQGYATVPATSDAKEYLRLLLEHKTGLLLALVLGIVLAALYLSVTPPVYESSALVEVRDDGNLLDRDQEQQINWNAPTIKEEANILRSRKVLAPVVDAYDLRTRVTPKTFPVLSALSARVPALGEWLGSLAIARSFAWNDETLVIAALDMPRSWEDEPLTLVSLGNAEFALRRDETTLITRAPAGEEVTVDDAEGKLLVNVAALDAREGVEFSIRRRSLEATISDMRKQMTAETSDTKSRMVTVRFQGSDPQETAILTNAIVSQYQAVKLGSETLQTTAELEFYQQSLPRLESELRDTELALATYRSEQGSIDQDTQIIAKLGQLDKLETEMTSLQIDREELLNRYTDLHPSTRQLDKEIAVLQRKINESRAAIQNAPDTERELTALMQQEDTARQVFNEMNEKLQMLRISQAGTVGSVQIWDEALPPNRPVSPNSLLALVGFTLTTLFAYVLFLTLRSALSTVINDQASLERVSGLPVFMNIPRSAAQKRIANAGDKRLVTTGTASDERARERVLALNKPEDYSIENLRGLRSMLQDLMEDAPNNALMITSPLPGMGKSFISVNLAVLLAQAGKRVLLIDADYQRGELHSTLGLDIGPGLPEVVSGKAQLKEAVRATSVAQLYCIAKGFSAADISRELPTDREMHTFMQVVAPRFDNLIIDTPPVLSVATAATIGKHVGSTIMVVREGEIKEPNLVEALKRLTFSGVNVSGCILNSSSTPTPSHYAYYREQLH